MIDVLIYGIVVLLVVAVPVIYFLRYKRSSDKAASTLRRSIERGQDEPVSLHPVINPAICIGSGACVQACPELSVLGIIEGKGELITPSHCIGHGQCEASCPVSAITLVFGTAKRGVDIPFIKGNFETNIPGMYIAGELGGMGLIRNAVTQGRQAVENIARSLTSRGGSGALDLLIVGAGPAGIAASLQAQKDGLEFATIDQEDLGGTVLTYPRRKLVMTRPVEFPIYGSIKAREIAKEELMEIFTDVFAKTGLRVDAGRRVDDVTSDNGAFVVKTAQGEYRSRRVLLAIGRRGTPRKLGVPGEKSSKVSYRLHDPEIFRDISVLVVGGGDSAVEAAVALSEQAGNKVHVSYRRETFFRLKPDNERRVTAAIESGRIVPLFNSEVKEIAPAAVTLQHEGKTVELPNDYVFVFAGGELPSEFLQKIGIQVVKKFGER